MGYHLINVHRIKRAMSYQVTDVRAFPRRSSKPCLISLSDRFSCYRGLDVEESGPCPLCTAP